MDEENLRKNIIKILIVFSVAFFILIVYLSYFEIRYGDTIITSQYNRRNKDRENEILRGTIYDRNRNIIADSIRQEDNTQKRVYKKGYEQAYAPVIGYYSNRYGTSGIEQYFAKELLNADIANPFKFIRDVLTRAERKGNSLILTIDSDLQKISYEAIGNYKGAAVAMDPKTGEILCMVSKPVFNPATIEKDWDNLSKQQEEGPFLNRAIQPGIYPPGSTFKVVVASKALEMLEDADSRNYECSGEIKINNYTLSDFGEEKHGKINIHEALVHSCNVTFGQVGMELGIDRLRSGAEDFYFNKYIPFDIQTAMSKFPSIEKNRKDSLAQSAIGQYEVTVTPLQMLMVASAVANKGIIMKPFIVKTIMDPYGTVIKNREPEILIQSIKKETAIKIKDMMKDVVSRGTGRNAKISGIEVAGKTGTAEVGDKKAPHSWFIAFAPAEEPKIAVSVIIENGETGGGRAASAARDIIKAYLKK